MFHTNSNKIDILTIRAKNAARAFIGQLSLWLPAPKGRRLRLYCNLIGGKTAGGPDRFLRNFLLSASVKNRFEISNLSLKNCASALVFSSSWGDSFTKICNRYSIRTILRVDGFYVPDDTVDDNYQHGIEYRRWFNTRLGRDLALVDHVIYQSQFSKRICDSYFQKREAHYSIIPNGTNLLHFKPSDDGLKNEVLKLVVLGKHYPKHLLLALDIFQRVLQKQPVELLIIGPMRDGSGGVNMFIESQELKAGLKARITCVGTVSFEKLPALLRSSDIFLHVKVGDCCPNAVIEAMGCGLPVVCPAWGGTQELVGEAGVSVDGPPWDIDEGLIQGMTEAVFKIQSDLLFYKRRARERTLREYDIPNVTKCYLDVLEYSN